MVYCFNILSELIGNAGEQKWRSSTKGNFYWIKMSCFPLSKKIRPGIFIFQINVSFPFLKPNVVVQKKKKNGVTGLVFWLSVLEAKKYVRIMLKRPCHDNCLWRNNGCFKVKHSLYTYNPTPQKCCHGYELLFCSVLLKLKLSEKRETGTSHLKGCFISLHFALSWITPLITLQDQSSLRLVKILTVNSCVKISNIWKFF